MIVTDKRTTKTANSSREMSSLTFSRTSSLREQSRLGHINDQCMHDNEVLSLNKRSLSNDKMSSDSMASVYISGKTAFPLSSPHSTNHHAFKIIKPIETSPRASESSIDHDISSSLKMSSQRLKFKHRSQIQSQGGPLVPDHSLMKEPQRENITFTPRPPLAKRFSSDQEETNSDIETGQWIKNSRSYQTLSSAPRPPISPTRGIIQSCKATNQMAANGIEKIDKVADNGDEDTSEMEDIPNSDCESPPLSNEHAEATKDTKQRSSLRKGYDSPNQSDAQGRGSPSPTKTVQWNLNAEVKKIPRSRSLNGKLKSSKSRSSKSWIDRSAQISIADQSLVSSHEKYISQCTSLMRHHMSSLESLRHERLSVPHYKKDLTDLLEYQKKLVAQLENVLDGPFPDPEKS